jgi:putative ABC transport system permease protein
MRRELHVRFCEGGGVQLPSATRLFDRLRAVPGVESAALSNILPASGFSPAGSFVTELDQRPDAAHRPRAGFRAVSIMYFDSLRIPIVRGRSFSAADREGSQQVAIVSASQAALLWPGRDPIGQRLALDEAVAGWVTVVGVAGDVSMYNWWDGIDLTAIYVPFRQAPPRGALQVVMRTRGDGASVAGSVRAAVATVDPLLALDRLRTMEQAIDESTFGLRFVALLIGISGLIALALSFVGVYSVMAYTVTQRRTEFGVRMALGATAADVLRLTIAQAGAMTGIGVGIGLALAVLLGNLLSSAVFGVVSLDASIFVSVSIVVGGVSLIGAYVPARTSSRLDPAAILRT